jgi:hypothetical protein
MTFSVAQYETVLTKTTTWVQELSGKLEDVGPAAATRSSPYGSPQGSSSSPTSSSLSEGPSSLRSWMS